MTKESITLARLDEAERELFEERAAVRQFDAGMGQQAAEAAALDDVREYRRWRIERTNGEAFNLSVPQGATRQEVRQQFARCVAVTPESEAHDQDRIEAAAW